MQLPRTLTLYIARQFAIWFGTESAEMRDGELDVTPGGRGKGTRVVPGGRRIELQDR